MRRAAALAAALLLAGCGGGDDDAATTAVQTAAPQPTPTAGTTEDADPAAAAEAQRAFEAFVGAAARGDTAALWDGLTEQAQRRLGPTEQQFAARAAGPLASGLGSLDPTRIETVVAEAFPGGWALVAVRLDDAVFATPLRRERGAWRVDVGGAVSVDPEAPPPGGSPTGPEVRARIDAEKAPEIARLWLDGRAVPAIAGQAGRLAAPLGGVGPGRHTVVAYVQTEDDAAATGWVFEVPG